MQPCIVLQLQPPQICLSICDHFLELENQIGCHAWLDMDNQIGKASSQVSRQANACLKNDGDTKLNQLLCYWRNIAINEIHIEDRSHDRISFN